MAESTSERTEQGMFSGMVAFFVESGIQRRRLQVWKQKLAQMGASIEDRLSKSVTHVFASSDGHSQTSDVLKKQLRRFEGRILSCEWIEDSLGRGDTAPEDSYLINTRSDSDQPRESKKLRQTRIEEDDSANGGATQGEASIESWPASDNSSIPESAYHLEASGVSLPYSPPDLNSNITKPFEKLISIYRALGDDRRSFSYYKAISVIEKVPFRIENADQVKDLPSIGKSMKEHVHEILTTGKLSKLEHFQTDERVKTISLFGEVWGIGPATALKLYDKGHRTLDDLQKEEALNKAQRLGLKYFDDIKQKIPREEVHHMERLLQKAGEDILPAVVIICGGSFRRGKAACGDLDVVITHPDGKSHMGFLTKYVKRLKDMNFLREDLMFSIHSEKGTDSMVDTYFGFCTYPGRELRHRIDLKVYPSRIYAFGLIAWTGNDVLNRRLRLLAESKGYRLDDTGLFLATQESGGKRSGRSSKSLTLKTEKEVFDFLGFPWLEPHQRNL